MAKSKGVGSTKPPPVVIASVPTPVRGVMAPIPNPPELVPAEPAEPAEIAATPEPVARPEPVVPERRPKRVERAAGATGRAAIAEANAQARATSRANSFINGVQVFSYEPGRLYEVWAAPYRVTTLTLAPGETVTSKAAGDTVRWQIGETTSGSGPEQRAHVILKPLQAGLETNLVVTTSQRVYMLMLRSAETEAFNAAVAWDYGVPLIVQSVAAAEPTPATRPDPLAQARLNSGYRIEPKGRRPRWTPASVFDDGVRTYIAFAADLQVNEAPVLFVIGADGEAGVVNYRQQGDLFVVDRIFDRAELRLGAKRPEVVRISRARARRASL